MVARARAVSLPVVLLAIVSVLSLGARVAWLGAPCHQPCRTSHDHLLIFDEVYYVNAARVIAGIPPPPGAHYANAPLGMDPNAEHPQLVKLAIAGAIELFGDGPLAWRLGSLIAGSLAILGMFALARAAGAGAWVAAGAAALMAADNLLLVAGRIGTLDIYAVAAMVWAAALYLRGRPLVGGIVLGIGAGCKEVAPYVVLGVALFEVFVAVSERPPRRVVVAAARRVAWFAVWTAGTFLALLAVMDRIAPPWDAAAGRPVTGGALGHLRHIVSYASHQSSPHGLHGIASYPWEWLGDFRPIVYLNINPERPSPGLMHDHPQALFLGMVSPPILLAGLIGLVVAAVTLWRRGAPALTRDATASFGLAWFLGTWLPFEGFSLLYARTSYLYYMVIVMPGIYLVAAALAARVWARRRWPVVLWGLAVVVASIVMYPFFPLF
jgi:hypothetical protein